MSEQNILNPSATSLLNPDYAYTVQDASAIGIHRPVSGAPLSRVLQGRGRVFELTWAKRPLATKKALEQWERKYRTDFFSYYDIENGRYYSGKFLGPLQISPAKYEQWDIKGQFEEFSGLAMYAYPGDVAPIDRRNPNVQPWVDQGVYIPVRDGKGANVVKLTGTWFLDGTPSNGYFSDELNATAEWLYFGYGVRIWSGLRIDAGQFEWHVDGVSLGTVNCYNVSNTFEPVEAKFDLPLGWHRVKMRVLHTKDPASANYLVWAQKIEVMQ